MVGRPPKPTELKRKLGNPGKRPLPDIAETQILVNADTIPQPPAILGESGVAFWDRVWSLGDAWISHRSDYDLVLLTAELIDERALLRQLLSDHAGESRLSTGSQGVGTSPLVGQLRAVEAQLLKQLSLLGLSPSDRSKLGVAEVRKASVLEELLERRQS